MNAEKILPHSSDVESKDRATWVAFVLMVLFAGGNPVAVRISNFGLPPFWGAAMRGMGAALVFWLLVALRRIPLPRGRALTGAMLYGLLSFGGAYAFIYWGLVRVPAGLGSTLLALVPLMTLFFAWAHGLEQIHWRPVAGALMAIAGVMIGLAGGLSGAVYIPSVLALVVGVAFLAEGAVILKLYPKSHPLAANAVALTTGAPILLVVSLLAGETWRLPGSTRTWAAYGYLVLIGSVAMFYLYLTVLSRWTASATSYSFLLIPVASVVVAAWVLGEAITASFLAGAALVLAGVWFGVISSPPKAAELVCPGLPTRVTC
jgi:drug/metabolite transporter (DMT)-like permease